MNIDFCLYKFNYDLIKSGIFKLLTNSCEREFEYTRSVYSIDNMSSKYNFLSIQPLVFSDSKTKIEIKLIINNQVVYYREIFLNNISSAYIKIICYDIVEETNYYTKVERRNNKINNIINEK